MVEAGEPVGFPDPELVKVVGEPLTVGVSCATPLVVSTMLTFFCSTPLWFCTRKLYVKVVLLSAAIEVFAIFTVDSR